jgi:hypothetical protein
VHHVAEIPKTIPALLLDVLQVEGERALELFLDRPLEGGRSIRQAPNPEGADRVQILRRADEAIARCLTDKLLLTVPIVLYGIFRYLYLVYHRNDGGNPAHALLTDGPLGLSILPWGLVSGLILYTAPL